MKIGIVSDLHGRFAQGLHDVLRGCGYILCAGDVEREDIIWQLQTIAPVVCVRGNNDWRVEAPLTSLTTLGGVRFFMSHYRPAAHEVPEGVQAVVFGHTHIPCDEVLPCGANSAPVRFLNPGSTTYPRGGHDASCMVAQAQDGQLLDVQLLEVPIL